MTDLAAYATSDDQVAGITPDALVVGKARGTVAISVRYLDELVGRHFTFVEDVPGFAWTDPRPHNFVDEKVFRAVAA